MSLLASRLTHTIASQHLFNPGDTIVVALSGGADSTALLDILTRLSGYDLHLIAAHVNHCLRGTESDADQEFCRGLAANYTIPFESRRIDVKKMASDSRLNLEDAGRRARIEFFDEVRTKYNAVAVVLAHHADDQAETVLMRLLRGSGMTGLSGMAFRNGRGYVRPLLEISRAEIERYLLERGLKWREDASNGDTIYLRNRIRHQLLPLLEEYNPAIRSCLAATASLLAGDEALLAELTEQAFNAICRVEEGRIACSVGQLRTLNTALRRRVLRHSFELLYGSLQAFSQAHVDAIFEIVNSARPNSRLSLPHGITALREYDQLTLMCNDELVLEDDYDVLINEPGNYQLPGGGIIAVEPSGLVEFPLGTDSLYLDLDKIPFPWHIRTFRPGDRMVPFGMSGRKKVKDIFIDKKTPLSERRRIPFLVSANEVIWIPGVITSERCRIKPTSDAVVRLTWFP